MSMAIGNYTGINNSYQSNIDKTNTGGTSEYKSVQEYSNYLTSKYRCLTTGKNVSVSVTSGLMRKAMGDEKTGEWLERELSKATGYIEKAQQSAIAHGSKLISVSIEFGEEYSTMTTIGVFGESDADSLKFKGKDLEDLMQKMFRAFPNRSAIMTETRFERNIKSDIAEISEEGMKACQEAAEEPEESTSVGGSIGINVGKLARKLAAAQTKAQVQAIIEEIKQDLKECEAGKEQGMEVDEASVKAAKNVLGQANQRMSEVANREATPEEEMAFSLAALM